VTGVPAPSPSGDLLGMGAGRDPQSHGRAPKVVDAPPHQPGRPGRRPPGTGAEGDHPQRPTL